MKKGMRERVSGGDVCDCCFGVMGRVLASSGIGCGFDSLSGKSKDYLYCCLMFICLIKE